MSAVEKIHEQPLTPRDLALQLFGDAVDRNDGDAAEAAQSEWLKAMKGRRRGLIDAALIELFAFYIDGKKPQTSKKLKPMPHGDAAENEMKRHTKAMRRLALEQQAEAIFEKEVVLRITTKCTLNDLWKLGNKFGKRGDKRHVVDVYSESQLAKARIKAD
jgi:hypothetical protein